METKADFLAALADKGETTEEIAAFARALRELSIPLPLDAETREIIGAHVGDRSARSAQRLWDSLPQVYRQCALIYTDAWEAYQQVLPRHRHRVVSKSSGKTSYIERFNNTLRQRVSRFVRRSLAFSKSLRNHIGLLWNFIHHYNASLPL